ncbi:MAG TPA: PEP/pyruvate-binding domain-containing protein [Bryobacteraceae bacterium]|nr:PEP/pyruvate-binding domain-containing protein [Bryobacteraceae bacterium]
MPCTAPGTAVGDAIIAWFDHATASETAHAGGKGASLSRMLTAGLPVPPGFVICAGAFQEFLGSCHGADFVSRLMTGLDVHNDAALADASAKIQDLICSNPLLPGIARAIRDACGELGKDAVVAVRSSAIGEDSETASFAGQQETFLNVRGADAVERCVKECWASFFAPRAIFYRAQKGVLTDTRMAVVVQEMVPATKSGVLFTLDPVMKRRDHMVIEAVFGLGEGIVSGMITPDHYVVDRDDGSLVREFISMQPLAVVHDAEAGGTMHRKLSEEEGGARVLSDDQLNELREMGLRLEVFFGAPQDVEWCIRDRKLWLLQSRPITTL